jgi:ferritin
VTPDEDFPQLLASIKTPAEDAQGPEGAMRAIWEAMDGVARISQRITKQTGHLIRVEAARTEKDQSPYQPLQAYMDEEQIQRHVEP